MSTSTKPIREQIRDHQTATGCTDDRMVGILCDFIQKLDDDGQLEAPWDQWLFEFVIENLERGPGDVPVPSWRTDPFTEQDRQVMRETSMAEVSDASMKDLAEQCLDNESLIGCIGYACRGDPQDLSRMLLNIDMTLEYPVDGEFLRSHDDDGEDYAGMLDFAKRMGLIDEEEKTVTPLGVEFREYW